MAVTNPATMIAAAGVFAAYGPVDPARAPGAAAALVAGVFAGSATWWLILASLVAGLRERFVDRGLKWLNRVSGILLTSFGAVVIVGAAVDTWRTLGRGG